MTLWSIAIASFLMALSGAMSPGPLLVLTVGTSVKRGWLAGPLIIAGHAFIEAVLIVGILAGLGTVLQEKSVVRIIGVVGGIVLFWMGFSMMKSSAISMEEEPSSRSSTCPVRDGILCSISSPYWFIWWATVGMACIALAVPFGWKGVAVFFIAHIFADFSWYTVISMTVGKGRKFLSAKAYQYLFYFCGLFLIGFGCWLAIKVFVG
jgi:threonine/homoserine/homoserine lactone efflux protein